MPGRVEHDPDVGLWLEVRDARAERDGVLRGRGQVGDLDVQMELHLLLARRPRPDRPDVVRAGGWPPRGLERRAREHYREEGTPMVRGTLEGLRVDLDRARWSGPLDTGSGC